MGSNILGCGVDLIEISRVAKAIKSQRFRQRVYSSREIQGLEKRQAPSWAARFAAKEAVMKALGCGWQRGVGFLQIEILQDSWGKPFVELSGKALMVAEEQGISKLLVSLSHSRELATAYVVALGEEK